MQNFFACHKTTQWEICPTRILYAKGGEDVTVYADILFIVNLYVDALLLSAVRRFLRLPLKTGRWLLAAALGGLFGLSVLLPHIRGFPLLLLGLLQALLLAAAAFAPKPPATLLKAAFLLLLFGAALGASEPSAVSRHSARQRRRVPRHLRAASDRPRPAPPTACCTCSTGFSRSGSRTCFFNRHGRFWWKTGRAFGEGRHRPDAARAVFGPAGHRRGARGGLRAATARLRRPGRAAPRRAPADPLHVARRRRPAARLLPPRTRRARR